MTSSSNPAGPGGAFWEEEWKRVLAELRGELVEDSCQVCHDIHRPFLAGVPHGYQEAPSAGPGVRRRTAADLMGDNRGPPSTFGAVIVGGPRPVDRPRREPLGVGSEARLRVHSASERAWGRHPRARAGHVAGVHPGGGRAQVLAIEALGRNGGALR